MNTRLSISNKSLNMADLEKYEDSSNEPLTPFKMLQLNEVAKPLTKLEALQLAIAMTPENVLSSESLEDDDVRIAYFFNLAEMILLADRKKFG